MRNPKGVAMTSARSLVRVLLCTLIISAAATVLLASKGKKSEPTGDLIFCGRSVAAQALTKGEVSLALTGTGRSVDVGFAFVKLTLR
jgi:hypothetical protein